MGSVDVPRTGFVLAANLQHFSGKPWAATAQLSLPQGDQRILLEPRGSRRLSSQSLLDLRVSRTISRRRRRTRSSCSWTCSMRSMTRPRKAWRRTICSARTSGSPRLHGSAPRHDRREAEPGTLAARRHEDDFGHKGHEDD